MDFENLVQKTVGKFQCFCINHESYDILAILRSIVCFITTIFYFFVCHCGS